ncbi:LOW QUALITY PROTEIN: hypothetical protein QYF61_009323 [Mycteria americana]|uniref:Uncharacterized protein n=1 Tax=Mycteria americana TaxID=33587 RepID=A0AAN7PZW2_MYCAM|nr:LOW QUALITY PROTEIN: hypothetical protein QYF61_009323 [Mycteria americana]
MSWHISPPGCKGLVDTGAQCTLMPSSYKGAEPICISGVTGGSQQLTALEAEVGLLGMSGKAPHRDWPIGSVLPWHRLPDERVFRGLKKVLAFGIAALEREEIKQLSTLPSLLEDPSVVRLLKVEEQQVPTATTTVHERQYHTNGDSLILIQVISKTRSPFNSPIWPVQKSNGEWRLTVDYCGLNEVTLPLSAAMLDIIELQVVDKLEKLLKEKVNRISLQR